MPRPPPFDAVVFDLDGTLVATDRFWVDAARVGARRAFEELGLERPMPSAEQWMGMVGLPLALGFARVFPELEAGQRARVMALCIEEEERALRAGQAVLLPGAREMLDELRERGLRLGIASNCGRGYLDSMLHDLGLARWIEEARCLDSPGVRNKAGMVRDLLATFGTRSAVMVGDRTGDRDAAWENGLPHVHYARGFAAADELVEAEARLEDLGTLPALLDRRLERIEALLAGLGMLAADGPRTLAITGHSGSGKTLFARDAARLCAAHGREAAVVAFDAFVPEARPELDLARTAFVTREHVHQHVRAAFDVEALRTQVLQPHARGEALDFARGAVRIEVPARAVLIVEGLFLADPALRPHFARLVQLEVEDNVALRRIAGRDAWEGGPDCVLAVKKHFLPAQRAFDQRYPPAEVADARFDTTNLLGA